MAVQSRLDIDNTSRILGGVGFFRKVTIKQNTGRTADIKSGTVLTEITTAGTDKGKYNPITALTTWPSGVYLGEDIASADIVAGDVEDVYILVGGRGVILRDLVLENSLVMDGVITTGGTTLTLQRCLEQAGIWQQDIVWVSNYENS